MIAIYTRQSVDKKDSISIECQIDLCKKEINDEDFRVYTDKGFSGGNTKRPDFLRMLGDIKSGLIDKVIVYKLDRISRSILDFAKIIHTFKKYNVEFQSSTEKFDTSTPIGNAMLNITMVFAQLERETIQKRIKDNYYARGKKGFYMGGRAPYGFNTVKTVLEGKKTGTFEKNPDKAPQIQEIYGMYANTGMSLGGLGNYLNKNNIPAAQGGLWDSGKISRILRNPVYVKADADIYLYYKSKGCIISNDISEFTGVKGCYLYGKREANERKYTRVDGHVLSIGLHEGLVDSKTWLGCQYKLDENRQIKNSGKGRHSWLSGYVKCGYCNYAVSVVASGRHKYFNCRGRTNYKSCSGHSVPVYVDKVEKIIEKYIIDRLNEIKKIEVWQKNVENPEINRIKLKVIEIDNEIDSILNQLTQVNGVAMKYVNDRISSLDGMKNSLLKELKRLTESDKCQSFTGVPDYADNWNGCSLDEKKIICGFFISTILIRDDEIIIDWKLK